jgi:hypothetical protein
MSVNVSDDVSDSDCSLVQLKRKMLLINYMQWQDRPDALGERDFHF